MYLYKTNPALLFFNNRKCFAALQLSIRAAKQRELKQETSFHKKKVNTVSIVSFYISKVWDFPLKYMR